VDQNLRFFVEIFSCTWCGHQVLAVRPRGSSRGDEVTILNPHKCRGDLRFEMAVECRIGRHVLEDLWAASKAK